MAPEKERANALCRAMVDAIEAYAAASGDRVQVKID